MAAGGLVLEALDAREREQAQLPASGMALLVRHVGEYGPHAAAKQAGFRRGDIVLSFDGRSDFLRETDLLAYALRKHQAGDLIKITVQREGEMLSLTLPMQK